MPDQKIEHPVNCSVTISVATFQRNKQLAELLTSIQNLDIGELQQQNISVSIVDNDPEGGAKECVGIAAQNFPFQLNYIQEKRRGVSFVRNTALKKAIDNKADFIAFVDDDETVSEQWLLELLKVQSKTQAAAVFGPINSTYLDSCPEWIRLWKPHATLIESDAICTVPGGTCNALISMKAVVEANLRFDPRMNLSGGEDTLFFYQMIDAGYSLANSANGIVNEPIPENRTEPSWLWKRWYRTGITDALILNRNISTFASKTKALIGGTVRILVGAAGAAFLHILSLGKLNRSTMQQLYIMCRGCGMVAFSFGKTYEEYGSQKAD